ncbi:Unknown protein sequence [Pseudomonas syringae pv. maculicola]|nr:Unknown protein sequence [Pseudomonas syringae pv. maculicola]
MVLKKGDPWVALFRYGSGSGIKLQRFAGEPSPQTCVEPFHTAAR